MTLLDKVPEIPEFRGRFFRYTVNRQTNQERCFKEDFLVFSTGKRGALIQFLWLKNLWDELTREEFALFISFPEVLRNEKMVAFLQASISYPKGLIRNRLIKYEKLHNQQISSRSSYQGMKSMRFEIHRIQKKLPKTKPYSGYVKTPSAVGSKSPRKIPFLESPSQTVEFIESINWFFLLTVGEIALFQGAYVFPDENPKRFETVRNY